MSDTTFTGERLHAGEELFSVDLARHRAAYGFARESAQGVRVLDLGCGSGYGAAWLADVSRLVVGVDRISPDSASRHRNVRYVRADLGALPLARESFDLIVSFQVIEHLHDPGDYLDAIARMLKSAGTALITTPNLLTSDRVNPFHVHEYLAEELALRLRANFRDVAMWGVTAPPPVARYLEARLRRIRRIMKLDPLGLRDRLPRAWIEWLFGRLAIVVRRGIQRSDGLPEVGWEDFPIRPLDPDCIDLLAICRDPIRK